MRRAVVVLGTTAAGLAALFSYKTHVAGIAVASTSPAVTASPTTSASGGALAASASVSASPSKTAVKKAAPKAKPTPTPTYSATPAAAPATIKAAPAEPPTPVASKTTAKAAPSGTFTGSDASTQYGDVQVQISVANGKITDANDIVQPEDSIGSNAVSQLNSEVLQAQSASIQAVSGATYTSQGYISSLQNAVDKAGL
jgi:uncharacterized protein with FMN-binding domain